MMIELCIRGGIMHEAWTIVGVQKSRGSQFNSD